VACTPQTTPLSCTAGVSSAKPLQNTNETVTVRTSPGAHVTGVAGFATGAVTKSAVANGLGLASFVYPVGTATAGQSVNVAVKADKAAQSGKCATSFTPGSSQPSHLPANTVLKCPEVTFTNIGDGDPFLAHAYLIETSQVNCTEAEALATHSRARGLGGGSIPFQLDDFVCGLTGGSEAGDRYTCQDGADLITFEYANYSGDTFCPSTDPKIGVIVVYRTDCATAAGVISDPHTPPMSYGLGGPTQYAFRCGPSYAYVPPGYTVNYLCTSYSDQSAHISFLEKGDPLFGAS
jgi:hypothetical protein